MKKLIFVSLLSMFAVNLSAQIVEESSTQLRWDRIMNIRRPYSELRCQTELNSGEKLYQINSATSNQFDTFILTIGDLDGAIATIEYLIKYSETADKGNWKIVKMVDGDMLSIKKKVQLGVPVLDMSLTGCAGLANITLPELNRVLKKLTGIKEQQSPQDTEDE